MGQRRSRHPADRPPIRHGKIEAVIASRIKTHPNSVWIENPEMILGPITESEAEEVLQETNLNTSSRASSIGRELPEETKIKIRRCLHASLRTLLEQGIIKEGHGLIAIFPQLKPLANVKPAEAGSKKKQTEIFRTVPHRDWPSEWLCELFDAATTLVVDPESKLDVDTPELQRLNSLITGGKVWAIFGAVTIGILIAMFLGNFGLFPPK